MVQPDKKGNIINNLVYIWSEENLIKKMDRITKLPAEILEHIFLFLDGYVLCRNEIVCKVWREVIKSIRVSNSFWYQACKKEVPEVLLEEILCHKPVPQANSDVIDWKLIYKKWFQGRIVGSWLNSKKHAPAFDSNPVTCVRHSGSFIITGHNNGCICIWNQLSGLLLKKQLLHLKTITDMALVDLLNLGFYGSSEYLWGHHHIITISRDTAIRISFLLEIDVPAFSPGTHEPDVIDITYHSDVLEAVKVFGDSFAVLCRDNSVTVWNMEFVKTPSFQLNVQLQSYIIGTPDVLRSLGYWHGEVQIFSFAGHLKCWKRQTEVWEDVKNFPCSESRSEINAISSISSVFIFRDKNVILLTADAKMIVSIGTATSHYHLMKTLRTSVLSVAFFGTLLALGAENGKLFLYHVPKTRDLLHLSLSEPDYSICLSEGSITSVFISSDDDSPLVTACTTESIYILKWYSPRQHKVLTRNSFIDSIGNSEL